MKKIISILAFSSVTALSAASAVACTGRAVASLNDDSYKLELKSDPTKSKFDIMRWSSDAISKDIFKTNFIANLKKHNLAGDGANNKSFVELAQGDNVNIPAISTLLFDYNQTSNTATADEIKNVTAENLSSGLSYIIYDQNAKEESVASIWDGKEWTIQDGITSKIVEETGVYMFHFKIAIEALETSELFIGAKQNITDEAPVATQSNAKEETTGKWWQQKYYADAKTPPTTDNYDYRFDIKFYISLT